MWIDFFYLMQVVRHLAQSVYHPLLLVRVYVQRLHVRARGGGREYLLCLRH